MRFKTFIIKVLVFIYLPPLSEDWRTTLTSNVPNKSYNINNSMAIKLTLFYLKKINIIKTNLYD